VLEDPHCSMSELAQLCGISVGSIRQILVDDKENVLNKRGREYQLENNREQFYRNTDDAETKHDARLHYLNYKISMRIRQANETETVILITEKLRK
jgi:hypothetical protein